MKIAIMQPYFLPYAGYFRLFQCVETFVIFDCVQFPRRGWVHRNYFTNGKGEKEYLSLPLIKGDRNSTRIMDLQFREEKNFWIANRQKFPLLDEALTNFPDLEKILTDLNGNPIDYIEKLLFFINEKLGCKTKIIRSSTLSIDHSLKGQDRIIAICNKLEATNYVNLSGGTELYNVETFKENNITLNFLAPYEGSFLNILESLSTQGIETVKNEIINNINFQKTA